VAAALAANRNPRCDAGRARPEAVAAALGNSLEVAFRRWHEWARGQREFVYNGKLGITQEE
jgi:hypothetical protein